MFIILRNNELWWKDKISRTKLKTYLISFLNISPITSHGNLVLLVTKNDYAIASLLKITEKERSENFSRRKRKHRNEHSLFKRIPSIG